MATPRATKPKAPTLAPSPVVANAKRPPGRPSSESQVDVTKEYTRGGSQSMIGGFSSILQYERYTGSVDDIDIRLGWDAKEQMDRDPFVSAALDTKVLGATARQAEVIPASKALYQNPNDAEMADELAAFVRRCLVYLAGSHKDINLIAFQLARSAIKIGNSKAEQVLRLMDTGPDAGKWVPDRIKAKSRWNSAFVVDRQGNIAGIASYTGLIQSYKNPYNLPDMGMDGMFLPWVGIGGWELLPRDKFVVMTNNPVEDDNPLGHSDLRCVYTAYRMKRDLWAMYLKSLDNTAIPFIAINQPSQPFAGNVYPPAADGTPDTTKPQIPMATALYQAGVAARQGGILVLPHDAGIKQLYNAQSGSPFMEAHDVFNSEITQGILLQGLATGVAKHMARSASETHQDTMQSAIRQTRRMICDTISRDCFTLWVKTNFPDRYWHLMPTCSFGEVELNDFAAWADAISKLATSGMLDPSQRAHIHAILGLPQSDPADLAQQEAVNRAIEEEITTPVISPTGATTPSPLTTSITKQAGNIPARAMAKRQMGQSGDAIVGI